MCHFCDDPVPDRMDGDPATVRRFATTFQETANALREAAAELRNLANENITISLAVDEVRGKAEDTHEDTARVAERYEGAAGTYSTYANSLDSAQQRANGAVADIIANNEQARHARHQEQDLRRDVQWGRGDDETVEDLQTASQRVAQYAENYVNYLSRYNNAVADRDAAVDAAVGGLADAESAAALNDGFWDSIAGNFQLAWELFSKYVGPIIEILREALEVLKQIVDILALVLTVLAIFIPVLGPIAAALTVISALMAVAIFACSLMLFAMGRESLGRVLSDGVSALTSVLTARMGGSFSSQLSEGFGAARTALSVPMASYRAGAQGRNFLISQGEDVLSYSAHFAKELPLAATGGVVSSHVTLVNYGLEQGLDFQLSGLDGTPFDSGPWESPAPESMLPGLFDAATFGTASPVASLFDWDYDFGSPAGEVGDNFASVFGGVHVGDSR